MPDPDKPGLFSSERGMLASLGERRRWWHFGGNGAQAEDPEDSGLDAPESGSGEDSRITHSMLGSLARRAGSGPVTVAEEPPESRSLLSLSGPGSATPPGDAGVAGGDDDGDVSTPLIAHSTLGELAGLEEHSTSPFPIERFILVSLILHVILVVILMVVPAKLPAGSKGDLFSFVPEPKDDTPIPVIFSDVPGPARPNPKRSPLSDADRRAGGGDPSKPKAASPFVPPSTGVAGLAPGPRAPRVAGSQAPPRPGDAAEPQRRAPEARSAATDQKPSEFPSQRNPVPTGPSESTKLAGLDTAIREAARGAVGGGGERGSPNGDPEGGFVDSGPVSFDSSWYDWGPYAAEMVRRIKLHWDVPELARLGWKGTLTVRFFILGDGTVADAKILRGSGIPPFDFAAFQAIIKSSKFRPLPADLHSNREGVTVTFFYNLRPEGEAAGGQ